MESEDTCLGIKLRAQDQLGVPVTNIKLFRLSYDSKLVGNYIHGKGLPDEIKPFLTKVYVSHDTMGIAPLIAITDEEFQSERTRMEEERKEQQKKYEEQRRAQLQAAAAETGLTVEEYEAEQARKREEAELERQRRIQAQREEQANKVGRQGYRR